ncbi:MAG TPA: DUF58 domain-containing protein [Segetibacter sp.]|jgi:uncharacterized protein (DUF58 family)
MSRLLDPKILMAIKDLSLAAKTTIDGFMSGINKSSVKGHGLEFSQYRTYEPGDDLRWLDWKMYARSDRYFIRESEVETSIPVKFLIDASASMNHVDNDVKKIEYARYLAASLGYLANGQGDAIGLYVFQNGNLFSLPSRQSHQHLNRFFYQLEHTEPAGRFTEAINYKEIFAGAQKKELLVFVTDFHQQDDEIYKLLDSLASLKHEIIVFHILGKNEVDLDYKGYSSFEDLESGETIQIDVDTARKVYAEQLQKHLTKLREQLLNKRVFYRMLIMNQPLDEALRDFLNQRKKLRV